MSSQTEPNFSGRCDDCGTEELSSRLEIDMQLCVPCIEKLKGKNQELQAALEKTSAEGIEAVQKLTQVSGLYNKRLTMDSAERSGRDAALKGLDIGQNPYEQEELKLMWEHGFGQATLAQTLAENQAVVAWALTELPLIHELAENLGPKEVAEKLDSVIQRLSPVVAELLQS